MATSDYVQAFAKLDTACVSDALDRLGLHTQVPNIQPLDPAFALCGPARTIRYELVDEKGGTVGDYIDEIGAGEVLVLDNAGRTDCTVWGDILTSMAHRRAIAGTVIDGICRDAQRSLELAYPIFSRGRWMRTGKDRVRLAALDSAVELAGVVVKPGDLVRGDADGVVVVPANDMERVLETARAIDEAENTIRSAIDEGMRLDEARKLADYHTLQHADGAR